MDVTAPARQATVLVAVRSPQVREALAALIGSLVDFCVVGEAASHEQALAIAQTDRPRVAVVDEALPDSRLGSTIQALHEQGLADAIVAIGASPADIFAALNAALDS